LQQIIQTPEYCELEEALLEGRVSEMDEAIAGNIEELRNTFKVAVPVAARTLLDIVSQRRDLRASLAAAKEILDRDPDHTFTPVRQVVQSGDGQSGGAFNPTNAGNVIASMTADATKVTVQLSQSIPAPPSHAAPLPPKQPPTIVGDSGGATS
jgi:hypothetical protein